MGRYVHNKQAYPGYMEECIDCKATGVLILNHICEKCFDDMYL